MQPRWGDVERTHPGSLLSCAMAELGGERTFEAYVADKFLVGLKGR